MVGVDSISGRVMFGEKTGGGGSTNIFLAITKNRKLFRMIILLVYHNVYCLTTNILSPFDFNIKEQKYGKA